MRWEDYFWPGTKVLANKLDIHDAAELTRVEHSLARGRAIELANGVVDIPATFDSDHIRRLHHWLFQDVYSWAGQFRDVEMSKWSRFAAPDEIEAWIERGAELVAGVDWAHTDDDEFAEKAAKVYSYWNFAHPFRDGNGRATRELMSALAAKSRRGLDFGAISREVFVQRAAFSCPAQDESEPQHHWMVPVFAQIARPASDISITTELRAIRRSDDYDLGL
ncbi:Fic/DOC family protein [Mycobacterium avium]|uniref:Fic/DOC family protein n=1 Tax=Mycobacterium avium TaxID=1764 RepID=UPI00079FD6DB|nr:Fic family protein [Mycobacterium avium]